MNIFKLTINTLVFITLKNLTPNINQTAATRINFQSEHELPVIVNILVLTLLLQGLSKDRPLCARIYPT